MSEKIQLLATLQDCEIAREVARRNENWVEFQNACEACCQVGRRLELLEQQTADEAKL